MSYKVSEVAWADGGYGFNITGEHSVPLVHFSYLRERDAIAAAKQVRVAIANANLVKPQTVRD
jgi:hypothetical protein